MYLGRWEPRIWNVFQGDTPLAKQEYFSYNQNISQRFWCHRMSQGSGFPWSKHILWVMMPRQRSGFPQLLHPGPTQSNWDPGKSLRSMLIIHTRYLTALVSSFKQWLTGFFDGFFDGFIQNVLTMCSLIPSRSNWSVHWEAIDNLPSKCTKPVP